MSVKCWASVAGAGQYPFCPSQYFILHVPACCRYSTSRMLWTKAELMLAHRLWRWPTFSVAINTTLYPNTGLMLDQRHGPKFIQHWVNVSCLTACRIESAGEKWMGDSQHRRLTARSETDERTRVNQQVPTSLWEGRHNNLIILNMRFIPKPH